MVYQEYVPLWRGRAISTGFQVLHGREVSKMTEREIETAFDILARDYGYSYIWGTRQGVPY
jgi:hypothetical protein